MDFVVESTEASVSDGSAAVDPAAAVPSRPRADRRVFSEVWPWLPRLLFVGLGCGAILGLLQLVGGLLSVRAYGRRSKPLDDPGLLDLVHCLQAELCLTGSVELRENDDLVTAATIGWSRPLILLPAVWRDWTEDQRRAVLAHELVHIARGDYLTCVLGQLCLAVHFYHPLVHWLAGRLRLEQELAADATAAMLSGGRKLYLQSLAELALHTKERSLGWPAHTFLPTQGTFLRRIDMLRDSNLVPAAPASFRRGLRWGAAGLLILGAAVIAGLRGNPEVSPFETAANAQPPAAPKAAAGAVDLSQVSNDAKMLLAIRPTEVTKVPEIRKVLEALSAKGDSPFNIFTLKGIEQITLVGLAGIGPDDWGRDARIVVVQFNQPTSYDEMAKAAAWPTDALRLEPGKPYDTNAPVRQAYGVINDRTLVLGSAEWVSKYLANRRKGKPTIATGASWEKVRMGAIVAALDMEVIREQFRRQPATPAAGAVATLAPLWTDSEYVLTSVIVDGQTMQLQLIVTCDDAKLAGNVAETLTASTVLARNALRALRENQQDAPAFARFAMEVGEGLLKGVKVEQSESLVIAETKGELPSGAAVAAAGGLVGAVTQARTSAQRSVSMNNMKQIMLGLHNWADTYGGHFPPPIILGKNGNGKFPHSWRVELLPYLDQDALYRQYHFDEPWDSDANKKVLAQMPAVFRHPQDDPKSVNSSYFVLRSEKLLDDSSAVGDFLTAFSHRGGMPFAKILDGTSNTIAVVEAKRDIPWTKPDDILFDAATGSAKFGGFFEDGFNAALCDGSVRFITHKVNPEVLKLLIMPADGKPVPQY